MAFEQLSSRVHAVLLWSLTLLFVLRVLGQAIQYWAPWEYLPPFNDFQGSNLSYPVLLTSQLVILAVMAYFSWRTHAGLLVPSRRGGIILAWLGGTYMTMSAGRLAIGIFVPGAPSWFTAWIPAVFHLVLAAYVLTLAAYHLVRSGKRSMAEGS